MAKVTIRPDESLKDALRRFKKVCNKEGLINRMKRSARYEKPSEQKRREEAQRLKTIRKAQKNQP